MYSHETKIRVRYGETDRMGFAYYGHYATYYEMARVESIRALGISYREMEDEGILLPVIENHSYFHRPALYDDLLTIKTTVKEPPTVKIRFEYEITNEDGELINTGNTTLAFMDKKSGAPRRPADSILAAFKPFFEV